MTLKIVGTFFTPLAVAELATLICPQDAQIKVIDDEHGEIFALNYRLTIQGKGDVLIFGDYHAPLSQLDDWLSVLGSKPLSCMIDVHGDAARLLRRHIQ